MVYPLWRFVFPGFHKQVHYNISDLTIWKLFFDRIRKHTKSQRFKNNSGIQSTADPNDVFIIFELDSVENAENSFCPRT